MNEGSGAGGARALVAAGLLALAVCASGAAAEDDAVPGVLAGCVGSVVEELESVRTGFPGFRAHEVGVAVGIAGEVHDRAGVAWANLGERDRRGLVVGFCSLADDVGEMLAELRGGETYAAKLSWARVWAIFQQALLQ